MNALVTSIAPYVVPTVLIIIGYFWHLFSVHIPGQQRAYITVFAEKAVAMVEQKFAGQTDEQKKAFAMEAVKGFFKAFNLPLPSDAVISAFIEAAVQALPKSTLQGGKSA